MNKRKLSYPDYLKNLCIDIILNIEIYPLLAFLFNRLLNFAAAKSLQSFPTLCDPIDSSPPGSPVPGILQARTLEWVAISFSNAWKWKVKGKSLSRVRLLATPWTVAHQTSPSMGFSRQEYWSGVPLPSPKLCSNTNINWKYKDLKREKNYTIFIDHMATYTENPKEYIGKPLVLIRGNINYLCFWRHFLKTARNN